MDQRVIGRVLVANRGEIAVRVLRACRELGIEGVAVYSDADENSLHVRVASLATRIGPAPAEESYLSIGAIIDAARRTGADAVHPGYGFLAENPAFADAVAGAGLTFVGPPARVMEVTGSKIASRAIMAKAGIPVVPGEAPGEQSAEALAATAARVGYPVLVKASAGGGGRGMRVVRHPEELSPALQRARHEARAAFGDDTLYIERLVENPRHVEVQIVADDHGNVLHFFERDCSLQRRHQKIFEESPSPALTPALRARITAAAVSAARAVGYRNAGTIEFLLAGTKDEDEPPFYFLEMNTRLQVEHPVSEAVTGIDLVRAQFIAAAGKPLPWQQDSIAQRGHAVECRIYAEDPAAGFLPQAGKLLVYRPPRGPGIRVDEGVMEGDEVPVHYDALLAKLVATAETREAALEKARLALGEFVVLGARTNIPFLARLLDHPAVRSGRFDTWFLENAPAELFEEQPGELSLSIAAAVAAFDEAAARTRPRGPGQRTAANDAADPWESLSGWRN